VVRVVDGSADGEPATPDHTTLRLVHLPTPPDLGALDVKRTADCRLLGAPATVRVIGSSHCLSVPSLSVHELCSCRPLPELGVETATTDGAGTARRSGESATVPAGRVRTVPLSPGVERAVTATVGDVRVETAVEGIELEAFDAGRRFDVHYQFGPDAVTGVSVDGDRFETVHTYPEFGLALYSSTVLSRVE
jgi:hypothetical protein